MVLLGKMVTCFLAVFRENRSHVFWLFSQKKPISSLISSLVSLLVYILSKQQAPAQDLVVDYLVTSRLASESLEWHHLSSELLIYI